MQMGTLAWMYTTLELAPEMQQTVQGQLLLHLSGHSNGGIGWPKREGLGQRNRSSHVFNFVVIGFAACILRRIRPRSHLRRKRHDLCTGSLCYL